LFLTQNFDAAVGIRSDSFWRPDRVWSYETIAGGSGVTVQSIQQLSGVIITQNWYKASNFLQQ
jgi:hypothetical protein